MAAELASANENHTNMHSNLKLNYYLAITLQLQLVVG